MKALVTGGCGKTGSVLVKHIKDMGYSVDVVDDLSTGSLENLADLGLAIRPVLPGLISRLQKGGNLSKDDIVVITSDFTDDAVIRHIMQEKYDYIFHLADKSSSKYCMSSVTEATDCNLFKTVALADIAARSYVLKFIFASAKKKIDKTGDDLSDFFQIQKLSCEMFLSQFYKHYGLNSSAVRMSQDRQLNIEALLSCVKSDKIGAEVYNAGLGKQEANPKIHPEVH